MDERTLQELHFSPCKVLAKVVGHPLCMLRIGQIGLKPAMYCIYASEMFNWIYVTTLYIVVIQADIASSMTLQ